MSTTTKKRKRGWMSWKREVWGIVNGLPLTRAATVIRRIADDSLNAGEITRRTHTAANEWADRIYWGVRPGS